MTPATHLCAARASVLRHWAAGSTLANAASAKHATAGVMRAVVAASASSRAAAVPLLARQASTSSPSSSGARSVSVSAAPSSSIANPPHTTRPPPLRLPIRQPETSLFGHYINTGKAYLKFYKAGMWYLWDNTKQVRALDAATKASRGGAPAWHATRSDLILRRRWSHDMRRLPLFGLLLLICGEFTPFFVLIFPHVVPYTCRIPKQVEKLRRKVEDRRAAAFLEHETAAPSKLATDLLISRSLGLLAPFWDRTGVLNSVPGLAHRAVERRLAFLTEDDALLRKAGGVDALEPEEVFLASADRGLDLLGQKEDQLRMKLARWLALTSPQTGAAGSDADHSHVHQQMLTLLSRRPEAWPLK